MFGYLIKLPEKIHGYTHGWVYSETRIGQLRVDMTFGTVDHEGEFVPAVPDLHDHVVLAGDELEDFIAQVRAIPDRPTELPDHEYRSDDLRVYLESPRAERQGRIEARQAEREAAADEAAEDPAAVE